MNLIVGLTGGIATGKSTVAKLFETEGAVVISADELGHIVMDLHVYHKIVSRFLPVVPNLLLNEAGALNRKALGQYVFANPQERQALEFIVHPAVYKALLQRIGQYDNRIIVYECALLFETGLDLAGDADNFDLLFHHIITTTCPFEIQVQRLMSRNQLDHEEALLRISTQWSDEDRIQYSNVAIHTDQSIETLREIVAGLYVNYERELVLINASEN